MPVIASRGCRWSRCTFCGECFTWRNRSPGKVVDEIEWFVNQGFTFFHFNESDFNGDPDAVVDLSKEIIRRKLKVYMVGQLRIHKKNTSEYFAYLREAGFQSVRFGVDAWSTKALKSQKKGYSKKLITQNLKDCHNSGISVTTNLIVGVPGETEGDVDEAIDFILENKDYIDAMENINVLLFIPGSVYYEPPGKLGIQFRGNKEELYANNPRIIPHHVWYSVDPYIDHETRQARLARICKALMKGGVIIGNFAKIDTKKRIQELEQSKKMAKRHDNC